MGKKDYEMIAGAIFRSGYIVDKNKIRQNAREKMRNLIITDLTATLKANYPSFNENRFIGACKGL